MIDKLLSIGCAFDWITPTIAFIQDFFYGPVGDFGIPANAGWSRKDIKRLLNHYRVHVWGLMYNLPGEVLLFTVEKHQAPLAFEVLYYAGVPILYAPNNIYSYYEEAYPIQEASLYNHHEIEL